MNDMLLDALRHIDPGSLDYNDWLRVGMALKAEGLPLSVWDDWSRTDSKRYTSNCCASKWAGFSGSGVAGGTIMHLAKEAGWIPPSGHAIGWASVTTVPPDPVEQLRDFLGTLFKPDDIVGYCVTSSWDPKRGKYTPIPGVYNLTAGEILAKLESGDIDEALGCYNHAAGVWIRLNPLDGHGQKKNNVVAFRYVLVESDEMTIQEQKEYLVKSKLPIATLVHSGGKSLHAAVHIDADNLEQYTERVRFLFDYLKQNGFAVDEANKDPCRLSRLPGAERGDNVQELLDTDMGLPSWDEWYSYITESGVPEIVCAADVEYEPPLWTLRPYFPRGKLTMIQADSGVGKTAFMCAVAALISTGNPLIDLPVETPGNILMLSVEDDAPVLKGRFQASGGDPSHLYFLPEASKYTFDSPEIENVARKIKARMIVFDPFQAFLGAKVDMHRANETRPKLAHLAEMAKRLDLAIVIIAHRGKATKDKSAVYQALGSADIPAAMRSIIQIENDPEDSGTKIACHVKHSNSEPGKTVKFRIGERGGVTFEDFSNITVDDLAVIASRHKREQQGVTYENEPLVQVFNQLITDKPGGGFWGYADLKSEGAKILGFPPFSTSRDLTSKLDNGLARELQERDGLIVTSGIKRNGLRGVHVEQYKQPGGYQTKIALG